LRVYVDAGVSFGVSVAVSPIAVNCTDPGAVALPFVQASAGVLHVIVTVSAPGVGVGEELGFGEGVGEGDTDGEGDGDGLCVGDGDGLGVGGRMPPAYTPTSYELPLARRIGGDTFSGLNKTDLPRTMPGFPTVVQAPFRSAAIRNVGPGSITPGNVSCRPGTRVSVAEPLYAVNLT